MGSAFPAEPRHWFEGVEDEPVMFLTWAKPPDDALVVHHPHKDCAREAPHQMDDCGRFLGRQIRRDA